MKIVWIALALAASVCVAAELPTEWIDRDTGIA